MGVFGMLDESLLEQPSAVLAARSLDLALELPEFSLLILVHGGRPLTIGLLSRSVDTRSAPEVRLEPWDQAQFVGWRRASGESHQY